MAKKIEVDFKLLIAAIAFVILATVGSAFATYLIFGGTRDAVSLGGSDSADAITQVKRDIGPTYNVGEFTVNLASSSNIQTRFIRTGIVVEVNEQRTISEVERRHPQVRDRIITILRSRSVDNLNKPDGLEILRVEIIEALNQLLMRGEIIDVYFIDLVIQ